MHLEQLETIDGKQVFLLAELLTREECKTFIELLDEEDELVDVDRGFSKYKRNIMISETWAQIIWERVNILFHHSIRSRLYVNDHFRFSKYLPGQFFDVHTDGVNQDSKGGKSAMTINIFLNDSFQGGETDFLDKHKTLNLSAKPAPGRAAIFDRQVYHRGNCVREGFKYLLRTDVMVNNINTH